MQSVASSMRSTPSHSLENESIIIIIIILFVPIATFCSFVYRKVRNEKKRNTLYKKKEKKMIQIKRNSNVVVVAVSVDG
jgi:cell division protein YceG involved in septum cleavage